MAQKQQEIDEKASLDQASSSGFSQSPSDASAIVKRRGSEGGSMSSSGSAIKLDLGPHVPLSSFHYQKRQWRLPYGMFTSIL